MITIFNTLPFSFYLTAEEPAVIAESSSEELITIEIRANDEIFINGSLSSTKKLMQFLNNKSEPDKQKITISIKAEKDVIMNRLEKIQQSLMEMGVFKIGYIKSTGEQLNIMLPPPENEFNLKQKSIKIR